MHFEIYQQRAGLNALAIGQGIWRWRLRAANGEIIANGEGYRNQQDCRHAIDLVKQAGIFTPVQLVNA
jgi:uncharacterized protein YegP (UPF0339 family)